MKNIDESHKAINRLVYRAHIPKGLRPETNEGIDAMLDTTAGDMYSEEKIQRMMQKIKGQIPLRSEDVGIPDDYCEEMTEQERELLAMHRDGSEDISLDSQKTLEEMRKRAREKDKDANNEEK